MLKFYMLDMKEKTGVKDSLKAFTWVVGWYYLTEMAKIVEGVVLSMGVKNQKFCGQIFWERIKSWFIMEWIYVMKDNLLYKIPFSIIFASIISTDQI